MKPADFQDDNFILQQRQKPKCEGAAKDTEETPPEVVWLMCRPPLARRDDIERNRSVDTSSTHSSWCSWWYSEDSNGSNHSTTLSSMEMGIPAVDKKGVTQNMHHSERRVFRVIRGVVNRVFNLFKK